MICRALLFASICFLSFLIQGCSYGVQTTSGESYLEKYSNIDKTYPTVKGGDSFTEMLKKSAAVEPALKFPARIGIARVGSNGVTNIPKRELEHWQELEKNLGRKFGEFIPLTSLSERLATQAVNQDFNKDNQVHGIINRIRLSAARQHLDAVLIYEAIDQCDSSRNFLSVLDIALVTMIVVPSRTLTSEISANAILIDAMQGYHYGTACARSEEQWSLSSPVHIDDNCKDLSKKAKAEAVLNLTEEVKKIFFQIFLNQRADPESRSYH